jgi:hypothetical protein
MDLYSSELFYIIFNFSCYSCLLNVSFAFYYKLIYSSLSYITIFYSSIIFRVSSNIYKSLILYYYYYLFEDMLLFCIFSNSKILVLDY